MFKLPLRNVVDFVVNYHPTIVFLVVFSNFFTRYFFRHSAYYKYLISSSLPNDWLLFLSTRFYGNLKSEMRVKMRVFGFFFIVSLTLSFSHGYITKKP